MKENYFASALPNDIVTADTSHPSPSLFLPLLARMRVPSPYAIVPYRQAKSTEINCAEIGYCGACWLNVTFSTFGFGSCYSNPTVKNVKIILFQYFILPLYTLLTFLNIEKLN